MGDLATGAPGLRKHIVAGVSWSLVGAVLGRMVNLATTVVAARVFGRAGLGQYGIIQSTIQMFGTFAGLGLGAAAVRFVAEYRGDAKRVQNLSATLVRVAITWGGIVLIALELGATAVASRGLHAPELAGLIRLAGPVVLAMALSGALTGVLAGLQCFGANA
jgi:O-antigen/teichoic acid export membrane protein